MLTQRTRVHSAGQRCSVFLACHHFELWPSTYLVCLALRITRAVSSSLASDPDSKFQFNQRAPRIFCSHLTLPKPSSQTLSKTLPLPTPGLPLEDLLRRPFHKTLPLPARVWPLHSLLGRTTSRVVFFGRLQHCSFGRFRHSLTFRSTQFDLRETSVKTFMFSLTV